MALYQGKSAEALRLLEKAAGVEGGAAGNNESAATRGIMTDILLERGENAAALAMAERGAADAHGGPGAFNNIGASALAATRLRRASVAAAALATLERYHGQTGVPRLRRYLDLTRGRIALDDDRMDEGGALLSTAEAASPPGGTPTLLFFSAELQPTLWSALGTLHLDAGRLDGARTWFERTATSGAQHLLMPIPYVESFYRLGQIAERQGDSGRAREHYRRFLSYWTNGDLRREWVTDAERKTGRTETRQ